MLPKVEAQGLSQPLRAIPALFESEGIVGMTIRILLATLFTGFLVSPGDAAGPEAAPKGSKPVDASAAKPGLVWVFFNAADFRRPRDWGVDRQVNVQTAEHRDYSQLWLGRIHFPATAEVTLAAEADNGLRLFLDGKPVIDGWAAGGSREGKLAVTAGQSAPVRLEFFQDGGEAILRLYWQWEGHPKELIPASALSHDDKDVRSATALAEGGEFTNPGDGAPVMAVPRGDEEFRSSIYVPGEAPDRGGPIRLRPGPHLFLDDFLISQSRNLKRRVNCPRRDPQISNPVITGKEDLNFQPYMTVLRDPQSGRFRIWYNARTRDSNPGASHVGLMESEDGIHWIRPPRVLEDPAPIQFGCSVLDDGPGFPDPARRYKFAWWHGGGLRIAASPDGLKWTPLVPQVVLRHNHDINNIFRDTLRDRYAAIVSVYVSGPKWKGQRRSTMLSTSKDLIQWEKPWYILAPDDSADEGQTQFYAMSGHLIRGGLWIGLVKVLRDDLKAPDTPQGAYGVGYTTLAWTRDGRHWVRDTAPYFRPDPAPGAWDHAHAWLDFQLPVGDEVYLYYGGYTNGHKVNRFEERQIGLVRIPRDRYVSRDAGSEEGTLTTPPVILDGNKMTVNADVKGQLRVRLLGADGNPIPGFDATDCKSTRGDGVAQAVQWKGSLAALRDKPVRVEFLLRDARLYGFDLLP